MKTVITALCEPPPEFDPFVAQAEGGSVLQMSRYAECLRPLDGSVPRYFLATVGERWRGVWLLREWTPAAKGRARARRRLEGWYGPVLVGTAEEKAEALAAFVGHLKAFIERRGYHAVEVIPCLYDRGLSRETRRGVFAAHGFQPQPAATFLVDTALPLDALHRQLPSETRTKLRKAERQGVSVEEVRDLEGLRDYWRVRCENWERLDEPPVPFAFFQGQWERLAPVGLMRVFLARCAGRPLAGQIVFVTQAAAHLMGVCVADEAVQRRVAANDALQWGVLRWAHERGCRVVDYVGAHPDSDDPKLQNIHRFKARWGGQLVRYHTFTHPATGWRRVAQRWLRALKDGDAT